MYIVTGGSGFIGSNIVKALNERGIDDILVVDNLTNGVKFLNLPDCEIADYMDKRDFIEQVDSGAFTAPVEAVFHLGACSATTEWDGHYIMKNNFEYSKSLLHFCQDKNAQYIYASSASVYGDGSQGFREQRSCESPLNVYGYSKFLFDQYVRRHQQELRSQVVGFRYFNVYGPREGHKGSMSSVAYHLHNQLKEGDTVRLFEGTDGYDNGAQRRDFIYVGDVVDVNLWFLDHAQVSGIFNVGTGRSQTFNDVAHAVIDWNKRGTLEYIPFPDHLKGRYQSFTEADISELRRVGYTGEFKTVEQGVRDYLKWLER